MIIFMAGMEQEVCPTNGSSQRSLIGQVLGPVNLVTRLPLLYICMLFLTFNGDGFLPA